MSEYICIMNECVMNILVYAVSIESTDDYIMNELVKKYIMIDECVYQKDCSNNDMNQWAALLSTCAPPSHQVALSCAVHSQILVIPLFDVCYATWSPSDVCYATWSPYYHE